MQVDRTRYYRVSAVADAHDVSPDTVYRWIKSGELDGERMGVRSIRITGASLAAFLTRKGLPVTIVGQAADDVDEEMAR